MQSMMLVASRGLRQTVILKAHSHRPEDKVVESHICDFDDEV